MFLNPVNFFVSRVNIQLSGRGIFYHIKIFKGICIITHATVFGNVVSCSTKCGVKSSEGGDEVLRMWCQVLRMCVRYSNCGVKILKMWCQDPQNVMSRSSKCDVKILKCAR